MRYWQKTQNEAEYRVLDHGLVVVRSISDTEDQLVAEIHNVFDSGKGKSKLHRDPKDLIKYLWRNGHHSVFGFPTVRLFVRAPIFVARQWFRHRTGLPLENDEGSFSSTDMDASRYHQMYEFSGRYREYVDSFYLPDLSRIVPEQVSRLQDVEGTVPQAAAIQESMREEQNALAENYRGYLEVGVQREIARIDLPMSQYTSFNYQQDLRNLLYWLKLRRSSDAQYEIRAYSDVIEDVVKRYFPYTYEAWLDEIDGIFLTREEFQEMVMPFLENQIIDPRLMREIQRMLKEVE